MGFFPLFPSSLLLFSPNGCPPSIYIGDMSKDVRKKQRQKQTVILGKVRRLRGMETVRKHVKIFASRSEHHPHGQCRSPINGRGFHEVQGHPAVAIGGFWPPAPGSRHSRPLYVLFLAFCETFCTVYSAGTPPAPTPILAPFKLD